MKIKNKIIPNHEFPFIDNGEWKTITTKHIFDGKKVIVFALPGAFTPTCSTSHLPRYEELYETFQKEGIDDIYCLSVNDCFVMNSWLDELNIKNIKPIPDGTGEFTEKLGMLVDKSDIGFGKRSWRYSMLVDNGVIKKVFSEEHVDGDPFDVSDADTMITFLNKKAEKPKSTVLITREGCPFCLKAKEYLNTKKIKYIEVSKNKDNIDAVTLRGLTGRSTYPQLMIEGEVIGGYEDIIKKI